MNVYMDYVVTSRDGVLLRNGKKNMVNSDGVWSVMNNNLNYTPSAKLKNQPLQIKLQHYTNYIGDKINNLIVDYNNQELRDEIIDDLTNDKFLQFNICKFVGLCPEYYDYFEPIVLNIDDAQLIYNWMDMNKVYSSDYMDSLIKSLGNTEYIGVHQLLLCDIINNSSNYEDAPYVIKKLKYMALELYPSDEFLSLFKESHHTCMCYESEKIQDVESAINDHAKLHEKIINTFYDDLPPEYQLGIIV